MHPFEDIPLDDNAAPQATPATPPATHSDKTNKSSAGPVFGIIIIVVLLAIGGLYFWGAHLNAQNNPNNQVPLIPAGDSTTTIVATTTVQ